MKANEFVEEVEAMGFEVKTERELLEIYFCESGEIVGTIYTEDQFSFDTEYMAFDTLPHSHKIGLYDLIDKYARTPIEER